MRRQKPNPDKYNLGRSSLVPYIASEGWQERHHRRKLIALDHKEELETWCNNHKWKLLIKNNGHHWILITKEQKMIEWWPSSGKLTIGKRWDSGIHCHDYLQLMKVLEEVI